MPLTPLSPSDLNSNLSSLSPFHSRSLLLEMAHDSMTPTKPAVVNSATDETNWEDGPSSPFVTELPVGETSTNKVSVEDMTTMTLDLTPSRQLKMESAPFQICEDASSMPNPVESTPVVASVKKASSVATIPADDTHSLDGVTTAEDDNIDDTCFSAFSEVPNMDMTRFARMGNQSPSKHSTILDQTPRASNGKLSPSATPTPRAGGTVPENDTTNLLLDFTQQFEAISTFSQRINSISRRSPSKSQSGESQLLSYIQNQRSPRKPNPTSTPLKNNQNILNLLDFELPPAPTPRSIPTITIRELESLKSSFASQISSLKATLSGREAEVEALKRAVTDAERRVGESAETAREETARRECVERDREEWERRGRDFEAVLRKVRAQVLEAETERGELVRRADEADERCREAEARVADAEARAARAESSRLERLDVGGAAGAGVANGSAESGEKGPLFTAEQVQKQIDEKVHALSTELHAIYKKKHITKVAGLKKGFEAKTKEKTSELQARVDALERQTEELQAKLDGTFSGVLPTTLAAASLSGVSTAQRDAELKKLEEQAAVIERQKAELAGRDEELRTRRSEYDVVMRELERERVEKGELVAAVDEMLALQSDTSVLGASMSEHHQQQLQLQLQNGGGASSAGTSIAEDLLRKSVGLSARPSGLARPGFGFAGQSKIAAPSSGLAKPLAGKSRMMSNIERMGGGRSMD